MDVMAIFVDYLAKTTGYLYARRFDWNTLILNVELKF
jgi:hypothetical protein